MFQKSININRDAAQGKDIWNISLEVKTSLTAIDYISGYCDRISYKVFHYSLLQTFIIEKCSKMF